MKNHISASILLFTLFFLFFFVSLLLNLDFPAKVLTGENSQATWMSGVLLVICAIFSLVIGMREGWFPWYMLTVFFFVLTADEHFMFHEKFKDDILFSAGVNEGRFLGEIPVIAGALLGLAVVYQLWKHLDATGKQLLKAVVFLGAASVVFDVFAAGVIWEEILKLSAELTMVLVLIRKFGL